MFSAFCRGVVARFVSRCRDSAAKDQNGATAPSLVLRRGCRLRRPTWASTIPVRALSLAFEGSEKPLFAAGLLVSFHCDAVK